ncbi:STAS/SEC14 domain-containing protein [Aureisphaera galaxeae]|uniref:STAS/SEC14 domain-containing protein n=1 Tax=Aureisphaera galaxeae TaxID=1538023 RepID=UPI002350B965|nr:STAS/SEC14 domain-containing protein [Aureisphaera galaxeae]MDC8003090.1 STAS/SEC14 domain-containing protein [Aureisphaera galaxeae]
MKFSGFSFAQDTIGYIIDGKMDTVAINALRAQILEKFEEHDKINLYLEDSGIESFTLNAVFIATLFPIEHAKRFHKIALVTNRRWIHMLGNLDTLIAKVNIRNFTTEERMNAMAWIARREE